MLNSDQLDFFKNNGIDIDSLKEKAKSFQAKIELTLEGKTTLVLTKLNYADAFEIFNIFLDSAGKDDFLKNLSLNKHINNCFENSSILTIDEITEKCTFEKLYNNGLSSHLIKVLFTFVLLNALPFFPLPTTINNGSK